MKTNQPEPCECKNVAEWIILDHPDSPDDSTFSCTEHLSEMVSDRTHTITGTLDSSAECCYLTWICPNCSGELQFGDGIDCPPVYCGLCGIGWDDPGQIDDPVGGEHAD